MVTGMAATTVFDAIAAPRRREILDLLRDGERSVGDLVSHFSVSQPAISQHLRVLRDVGLVTTRREGRQRFYRLDARPLRAAYDWVGHYELFWTDRFAALGDYLDAMEDDDAS